MAKRCTVPETMISLADRPQEAQAAANLVVAVADNKYFLARRLAEWGVGAPFLESAVACTAIAQEEAGHARGLYSVLEDLPREITPIPLDREGDRQRKYAVSYLVQPSASFIRGVAAFTLIDRATSTMLEALAESSFTELRKRAVRILGDEAFHQRFASARMRELVDSPTLEAELVALLCETLCWFGPEGEHGLELLVDAGIVSKRNEELRQAFLHDLGVVAEETGVRLPIERGDDGTWTYPELPWAKWNSLERRLPATPAPTTA
jgi:ring-1,2-phenylacetyl-CoA epoxidase subunit PaaC